MKVLFTFGGLPHYYNAILNKLNNVDGLEVHVVAPTETHDTIGKGVFQTKEGIKFSQHYLDEYKTFYGKPFFRKFINLIYHERPEIIITIWPYVLGFIFKPYVFIVLKFLGIKLALKEIPFQIPKYQDARDFYKNGNLLNENLEEQKKRIFKLDMLRNNFLTFLRRVYYNLVDAHLDYIEDAYEIIGSYGVKKEKIFIIFNSPDTDELIKVKKEIESLPSIMPSNNHRIIHIGRLVKWKKVDLLINAFAKIKRKYKDSELIIIGNGPEYETLNKQADNLGIEKSVKFVGGVYDSKLLGQYLKASSIYILAGMGGLSINEAMCFGKPVICSVCDGTEKKLVREDFNGKYFRSDDSEDLYTKVDFLFSNLDILNKMGENSEKIIHEEINVDTVIRGYLKAFNYLANSQIPLKY